MFKIKRPELAPIIMKKIVAGLMCALLLSMAACGTTPKRPDYTGTDSVSALSRDAFIGSWKYSVLNPAVEEERNVTAVYHFKPDGSFKANTEANGEVPMKMESVGTWQVNGEAFIISIEDIRETSGDKVAALALTFTKAILKKQTGAMDPYTVTSDKIVMVSKEHGTAVQLDRI